MSDKELDLLFKQKFDSFEPAVSPAIWERVTTDLGEVKGTVKKFPFVWTAAASVLVIAALGVWFNIPGEPMKLHGKGNAAIAVHKQPTTINPGKKTSSASLPGAVNAVIAKVHPTAAAAKYPTQKQPAVPVQEIPVIVQKEEPQLVATVVEDRQDLKGVSVAPVNIQSVAVKNSFRTNTRIAEPTLAATSEADLSAVDQSRKKIKTLAGLVNFVVGKVDRREDKLIELSGNDEGTQVSGINLGLFKIKSKNSTANTSNQTTITNK